MNESFKALGAYALTVFLAHVSARYHLSAEQSAGIAADIGTAVAALGGVYMHYAAYKSPPPTGAGK